MVEALSNVLPGMLDVEIAGPLAKYMTKKGVDLRLGQKVLRFEGEEGKVRRVVTDKGSIDVDVVVMAIGVRPNVKLAREAGLAIGTTGAIAVNEMLQTSDPDIYAGGDCAENRNMVTGARRSYRWARRPTSTAGSSAAMSPAGATPSQGLWERASSRSSTTVSAAPASANKKPGPRV